MVVNAAYDYANVTNNMLNKFKKYLHRYCSLSARCPVGVFFGVFISGILFWGAFNTSMELTNTETFCISCHEMEVNVYQEYKKTIHYSNRTGVRATCPDCHVPKDWIHKVTRKVSATNELFHKLMGSINTKEKFEAKRLELASHVWDIMKKNNSRECRNCHSFHSMALNKQKRNSRKKHKRAFENTMTCIDCHMGIAHNIAKDFDKDGRLHEEFRKTKRPCSDCHKDMVDGEW